MSSGSFRLRELPVVRKKDPSLCSLLHEPIFMIQAAEYSREQSTGSARAQGSHAQKSKRLFFHK